MIKKCTLNIKLPVIYFMKGNTPKMMHKIWIKVFTILTVA